MIYLIITTSIIDKAYNKSGQQRNKTYMEAIRQTLQLLPSDIQPIIVENNNNTESFLDNFTHFEKKVPVHYTNNNEIKYDHKGKNELLDIKSVIETYNIQEDDMIIKITGRYYPLNDDFFYKVIDETEMYDVFIKFYNVCTFKYVENDCVLGLYAMKCKYVKNFYYEEYDDSINERKSPEVQFATYIREKIEKERICEVDCLFLRCCFAEYLRMLDV